MGIAGWLDDFASKYHKKELKSDLKILTVRLTMVLLHQIF